MMRSRAYENKDVAVFGLGKSGFATARQLQAGHARVSVWDDNEDRRDDAVKSGLTVHDIQTPEWKSADILVLSPGVPLTHPKPHPVVDTAHAEETKIVGDIEIFLNEKTDGKIVGITGTNGKSTTTALIHHILKANGRETELGGNFGTPVMELPQLSTEGVYVLELSSYQLDLTPSWHADIAVLLNITPDHLDRHGDMAGYVNVKERIFQQQNKSDVAIINFDDEICHDMADRLTDAGGQKIIPISTKNTIAGGVSVIDGVLEDQSPAGQNWSMDISGIENLRGRHNWQNAAAAVAVARTLGLSDHEIEKGLLSFAGLAHRMELITLKDGVRYVNDSKATNAEAAEKALASFDEIYWICGGIAKSGGIESLARYFPRIRHAYLIGEAQDVFAESLKGQVAFTKCGDLKTAVAQSSAAAQASTDKGTVLLSPAAASFDQFTSFEMRGDAFRKLVEGGAT